MSTSNLLSHLRRCSGRTLSYLRPLHSHFLSTANPHHYTPFKSPTLLPNPSGFSRLIPFLSTNSFRFITSSSASDFSSELSSHDMNSITESELQSLGLSDGLDNVSDRGIEDAVEYLLPVRALISLLDGFHELTGLPWWMVIITSSVVLRMTLFPMLIFQLHKLQRIGTFFPKLPPPFPPPFSGRSWFGHFKHFRRERKAMGCPSYLWFLAYLPIQVPCFFLWMFSIRRMSLDHHPGFDYGGILWFHDLTQYPNGVLGPILPMVIAGLHFFNVQISFRSSSLGQESGLFGLLVKWYKYYLNFLTLPLFFAAFCIPQGSLVYWATNSSLTAVQHLSLQHPVIRNKLGLLDAEALKTAANHENAAHGSSLADATTNPRKIAVRDLSARELLAVSVKRLTEGRRDAAINFARLALDKDPEYGRALLVMGQILLQMGQFTDGTEYLERSVAKALLVGKLDDVEDVNMLIVASTLAGVGYSRQGKKAEALIHLERIASMEEPQDPKCKASYYDGLVVLASALLNEGRKEEAVRYLEQATAYNPMYNELLEQCKKENVDFVDDLVSSRRRDY